MWSSTGPHAPHCVSSLPPEGAPSALGAARRRTGPGRALVTGSSSGIGLAITRRLLDDGWQVEALDIAPSALEHPALRHHAVDLRDAAATELAVRATGPHQALVHSAGVLRVAKLGALRADDGQLMWRLHVDAISRIANIVLPTMQAGGGGRMVMIGSRVASGMAGRSQYAATKAALISLARSWAAETVASGITVNVVSPAATETAMLADPARSGSAPRLPPLGRLVRPEEIAALVAFLLSPDAAAITGQDIQICAGASLPL